MIKIDIKNYIAKENCGALKGIFSLVIHPNQQKILDCKHFVKGNQRWFSFPTFKVEMPNNEPTKYIPYVSYGDKEYLEQLKQAIMLALDLYIAKDEANEGAKDNQVTGGNENQVQGNAPPLW